jgi:hypothetical protein
MCDPAQPDGMGILRNYPHDLISCTELLFRFCA